MARKSEHPPRTGLCVAAHSSEEKQRATNCTQGPEDESAFDQYQREVGQIWSKISERKNIQRSFLRIPSPTCRLRWWGELQWEPQWWKEWRILIRYARMSFDWLFYTWASMNFFRHFAVKRRRLSLRVERLSCLYIQWCAYMGAIRKEYFNGKCVFLVYRGEGFRNLL